MLEEIFYHVKSRLAHFPSLLATQVFQNRTRDRQLGQGLASHSSSHEPMLALGPTCLTLFWQNVVVNQTYFSNLVRGQIGKISSKNDSVCGLISESNTFLIFSLMAGLD
jgi:hypothetical protein